MNQKTLYIIAGAIAAAFLVFVGVTTSGDKTLGSVVRGNEYRFSNAKLLTASTTSATTLKTGTTVLGSVILATTSTHIISLYNVASGANYGSTTVSTKIADIATGTPAGTYTFDIGVTKGLALYMPATSTTDLIVTYR